MNTEYLEIEKKIKNEMLNQVINSDGDIILMSLDKIISLVNSLNSIKEINNTSDALDVILYEDEKSMKELENRMRLARESASNMN